MSRLARERRARRNRAGPARVALIAAGACTTLLVLAVLGAIAYVISVADEAPNINTLKPIIKGATSRVFAADGSPLGFIQSDELRTPVGLAQIPADLRNGTVAIEDQRFYSHKGVDIEGVIRAAWRNITSHRAVQGGSTITMQLVRNLYLGDVRNVKTLKRKIIEAKLAMDYEKVHDKQYILDRYLNSVPYGTVGGQNAIGVQAAARIFFDKPASALTLPESALVAGLPQAPSQYNPFQNPTAALGRRNEVLQKMLDRHYITSEQAQGAMTAPLGVKHSTYYNQRRESFFFDYITQQLIDEYGLNTVRQGGLRIYTTIDLRKQQEARNAIAGVLNQPNDPSSAIVSIDPHNGYIEAMAESGTYGQSSGHSKFNLAAQGHRQPGSTFKTIVLITALKQGVDPNSTSYNSHELQPGWLPAAPSYHVQTFDHSYAGSINLVQATLKSDNTVYAQLDADVGPQNVKRTAYELGVTTHLDGFPAEGLGGLTLGVSPLEMANVYATVADGGWRNRPIAITKVVFPDGRSDSHWGQPHRVKVLDQAIAAEATDILQKNVQGGTGVAAGIHCPAAGKTGTVDNFTDAWFDGFTPKLASVVWVGYPNAKVPMTDVHGGSVQGGGLPAQIWHNYMSQAIGNDCQSFSRPSGSLQYHSFSGKYATGTGNSSGSYGGSSSGYGGGNSGSGSGGFNGTGNGGGSGNGGSGSGGFNGSGGGAGGGGTGNGGGASGGGTGNGTGTGIPAGPGTGVPGSPGGGSPGGGGRHSGGGPVATIGPGGGATAPGH